MIFNKSILVVQAHPDDTEAWCSGTLKLLKDRGYKITIVTMTAGGMGGVNSTEEDTVRVRREEAKKAAVVLGAEYICLEQRDGFLFDSQELRLKLISLMRRVKAGIVFTHLTWDYHSDHRTTAVICDAAAMISSLPNAPVEEEALEVTPLLYHTAPMTLSDPTGASVPDPNFFIDISETIETKMEMLSYHVSQQDLMRHMHKMDDFFGEMKKYNRELGSMCGVPYAECFWQHLGGGYQKDPQIQNELKEYLHYIGEKNE